MATRIRFGENTTVSYEWLTENPEAAQRILRKHKGTHPICLCNARQGVPLYIALKQDYYLSRMPGTADRHATDCPFFDAPLASSGLAHYSKRALRENGDDSIGILLDPPIGEGAHGAARNENDDGGLRARVSLRGLLDLLWQRAGFNQWHPNMAGRRTYAALRKYLLTAGAGVQVKQHPLTDYLYIPEPYVEAQRADIEQRTQAHLNRLLLTSTRRPKRMLVLGVVRAYRSSPYGLGLQLRQCSPQMVFWLNKDLSVRYREQYCAGDDPEKLLSNERHVVVLLAVDRSPKGYHQIAALAQMDTTPAYIPQESPHDAHVAQQLVAAERRFLKPLRYDADQDMAFPDFLLLDAAERPIPLEIYGGGRSERYDTRKQQHVRHYQEVGEPYWAWDVRQAPRDPPPLPPPVIR